MYIYIYTYIRTYIRTYIYIYTHIKIAEDTEIDVIFGFIHDKSLQLSLQLSLHDSHGPLPVDAPGLGAVRDI